jgi:ribosomal protein S18 acetylase RimI-like enzyme
MEPLDIEVRPVRVDEMAAAGEVTTAGYLSDGLLTRADGTVDRTYQARLADTVVRARQADVLVAVERPSSGVVLGTVTWCPPGSPWRELAGTEEQGEFRMLSVAPAGRGRGIGQALVAACLQRARDAQMREVLLSSLPTMTAAHRLYGRNGFVRDPELDHSPTPGVALWGFRLRL